MFQTPSVRGNGLLAMATTITTSTDVMFQTPSVRGNGLLLFMIAAFAITINVSNPFSAGQWFAAEAPIHNDPGILAFQTPSVRGNGLLQPQRRPLV